MHTYYDHRVAGLELVKHNIYEMSMLWVTEEMEVILASMQSLSTRMSE
jgi:hypothetical protein